MEDRVILHFKRAENVYLTDKSEGYEGFFNKTSFIWRKFRRMKLRTEG
jgi:hypothetical protein